MSTDKIEEIDFVTAIRLRPQMYVGDIDRADVVNVLVQECLCIALDNAQRGCADEVRVTLLSDGSISIWDNGPPLPLGGPDGRPVIEQLLTEIGACRERKRPKSRNLRRGGIVATNALSRWLCVDCATEGRHWRQEYVRGLPKGPFVAIGETADTWEQLAFLPDPEIFGESRVDRGPSAV